LQVRVELSHNGELIAVESAEFALGRVRECQIKVTHPLVSRRHCKFEVDDQGMTVIDLGSSNGTYVGDERIERHRLQAGEGVRIGLGGPEFVVVRVNVNGHDVIALDPEADRVTQIGGNSAVIGGPATVDVALSGTATATAKGPVSRSNAPLASTVVLQLRNETLRVRRSSVVLGRDDDCDVVLPHANVSRRHCEIVVRRSGAVVRDLGSRGGTWVAGRKVNGEGPIGVGDVMRVGRDGPELTLVSAIAGGAELPSTTPSVSAAPDADGGSPLVSTGRPGGTVVVERDRAEPLPQRPFSAPRPAAASPRGCLRRTATLLLLALTALAAACAAL